MKTLVLDKLIDLLLPLLVGMVVPSLLDLLKRANKWLDAAPAAVKQTMAFVIAGGVTALAQALGLTLPTDLAQWDGPLVATVVAGLLGIARKQHTQLAKVKAQAAAIPPLAAPNAPPAPDSPFRLP